MQEILFEILAPLRGATLFLICSGGFRFASTTGYYLSALRAAPVSLLESNVVYHHSPFLKRALIAVHSYRDGSQLL